MLRLLLSCLTLASSVTFKQITRSPAVLLRRNHSFLGRQVPVGELQILAVDLHIEVELGCATRGEAACGKALDTWLIPRRGRVRSCGKPPPWKWCWFLVEQQLMVHTPSSSRAPTSHWATAKGKLSPSGSRWVSNMT